MDIREFTIDSLKKYNARINPQLSKIPTGNTGIQRLFNIPESQINNPTEGDVTKYNVNGVDYNKIYHNGAWINNEDVEVVDNLNSTASDKALSANQGYNLKQEVNTKYTYPGAGIPKVDLATGVQGSLDKADSSVQARLVGPVTPVVTPGEYLSVESVVNNLTSGGTQDPLSAEQGKILKQLIDAGYLYMGLATPSTNPGTPTQKVFYIANEVGTYTNFGSIVLSSGIHIFKYDLSSWSDELIVEIVDNLTTDNASKALSAKQGKVLSEQVSQLGQEVNGIHYTVSDADVHQVDVSSDVDTPNGTRLRLVYNVKEGCQIAGSCSIGSGVAAAIYDTLSNALIAGSNGKLQNIFSDYVTSFSAVASVNGILVFSEKKVDGTAITAQEKEALLAATGIAIYYPSLIDGINEEVGEVDKKIEGVCLTSQDAEIYQVNTSSILESSTGNRLRMVYPVKKGWNIMVVTKAEKGVAVSLYDTMAKALIAFKDYLQTFTRWTYMMNASGIVSNDGYLSISLTKLDGSSISESEKNALINGTTVLIYKNSIVDNEVGYSINSSKIISIANIFRVFPEQYYYSENGTRLRIVLPIESGCLIKASTTNETGIYVAIYDTIDRANYADNPSSGQPPLQIISPEYGYSHTAEGVTTVSGFLSISFTNGETPITDEVEAAMLESLSISISYGLFKRVDVLEGKIEGEDGESSSELKELFLGTLLQKHLTASGLDDNMAERRVSMQSAIALPFDSVSLSFKLPDDYYVGIRHGNRAESLVNNSFWFGNGGTFTFPATSRYYRVSFGKTLVYNDCVDNVTPQEIQTLIDAGKISITYNESHNVIKDNKESEKYVKAMMREFFNDASLNNSLPNIPVFAHMSDIHGDAKRFSQFLDYCDFLGVDAALISGDFAALNPSNSCQYINDISDLHNTMVLPCTGNHDVRGLYTAKEQNEQVVGYLMTKNNVVVNSLEGSYPTYFYKDFPEQNIRVISLNVHELTRSQTDGCNFTETQANWFINTLANTPSSYGVLVMFHEPEVPTVRDEQNDAFYQPFGTILIYQDGITGSPISKIIDAFISKTTATITYTTQGTSVSVQADFTTVASGVEFIAFVCGHEHLDWVGLVSNTTNRQLILDVTCGVALYGTNYPYLANISDLPRGGNGVTQDAFNIYGIDRIHKTVRVARVGSNITSEAKDRKCMIIPYAI